MTTLLLTHPDCLVHAPPHGHPERPDRLRAVNAVLAHDVFAGLNREEAPLAEREAILRAHPETYVAMIEQHGIEAEDGPLPLDPDTWMGPGSLACARRAAGAATRAVDAVLGGEASNAFCAIRPPGHHAEKHRAMGFCLFNSIAVAARHAVAVHGLERVAIVDFDVHHGNGTQDIFWSDARVLYASTHQMPWYPGTGTVSETGIGNIFNAPLLAGDGGAAFRQAMRGRILPALDEFRPDLILVSAGFDAHRDDPLGGLELEEGDFAWITLELMELAGRHCGDRLVSLLEGGYDLRALAASTAAHVGALMRGSGASDRVALEDVT
jgi:acetoin utilization deacetylase AcuC-like enzyme